MDPRWAKRYNKTFCAARDQKVQYRHVTPPGSRYYEIDPGGVACL